MKNINKIIDEAQEKLGYLEEKNSFALEILKEQRKQTKRTTLGLVFIITLLIGVILYQDYQMKELLYNMEFETTTTEVDSEESGNAIYNESGEVDINGKDN